MGAWSAGAKWVGATSASDADVQGKTDDEATEGVADGTIRDEDPEVAAYGVVGAVGYYGHFHRTGRLTIGVDELAAVVGRFVVCALAADERIARRVLARPLAPA